MVFYDINLEVDGKVPRADRTSLIKMSTSNKRRSKTEENVNTQNQDYSITGKIAKLTDERIDGLFAECGASNPQYAQAYLMYMLYLIQVK